MRLRLHSRRTEGGCVGSLGGAGSSRPHIHGLNSQEVFSFLGTGPGLQLPEPRSALIYPIGFVGLVMLATRSSYTLFPVLYQSRAEPGLLWGGGAWCMYFN